MESLRQNNSPITAMMMMVMTMMMVPEKRLGSPLAKIHHPQINSNALWSSWRKFEYRNSQIWKSWRDCEMILVLERMWGFLSVSWASSRPDLRENRKNRWPQITLRYKHLMRSNALLLCYEYIKSSWVTVGLQKKFMFYIHPVFRHI